MFDTLSRRSNISPLIPFEWIIKNPLIWDQKHIENEKKMAVCDHSFGEECRRLLLIYLYKKKLIFILADRLFLCRRMLILFDIALSIDLV